MTHANHFAPIKNHLITKVLEKKLPQFKHAENRILKFNNNNATILPFYGVDLS
jgi:hypothetical protein